MKKGLLFLEQPFEDSEGIPCGGAGRIFTFCDSGVLSAFFAYFSKHCH
jgi:hypothetical protein